MQQPAPLITPERCKALIALYCARRTSTLFALARAIHAEHAEVRNASLGHAPLPVGVDWRFLDLLRKSGIDAPEVESMPQQPAEPVAHAQAPVMYGSSFAVAYCDAGHRGVQSHSLIAERSNAAQPRPRQGQKAAFGNRAGGGSSNPSLPARNDRSAQRPRHNISRHRGGKRPDCAVDDEEFSPRIKGTRQR